jgi:Cdc6-like AAA superfamily ATPase
MPREISEDFYSNFTDLKKDKDQKIALLAWGRPGTGKTLLAGSFPKPYFLDLEDGLMTVFGSDIKANTITTDMPVLETCINVIQDAKYKRGPFAPDGPFGDRETFVLDSLSMLSVRLFEEIMEEQKKDSRAAYGLLLKRMTTITSLLKELKRYGYHVVGTALEAVKSDDAGVSRPMPAIEGGFRNHIEAFFDLGLWLETTTRNGKTSYFAYSAAEKDHSAKVRLNLPHKVENVNFDMLKEKLDEKFQS